MAESSVVDPEKTQERPTERARKFKPNRLVEKECSLGFKKASGFEAVTNFRVTVGGYVADEDSSQLPIGYILKAHMEAFRRHQEENLKYV